MNHVKIGSIKDLIEVKEKELEELYKQLEMLDPPRRSCNDDIPYGDFEEVSDKDARKGGRKVRSDWVVTERGGDPVTLRSTAKLGKIYIKGQTVEERLEESFKYKTYLMTKRVKAAKVVRPIKDKPKPTRGPSKKEKDLLAKGYSRLNTAARTIALKYGISEKVIKQIIKINQGDLCEGKSPIMCRAQDCWEHVETFLGGCKIAVSRTHPLHHHPEHGIRFMWRKPLRD